MMMHAPHTRPESLGFLVVSAAVVFALGWLFNAWKLGKFKKKKSSESPADSRRSRLLLALGLCSLLAAAVLFFR